MKWVINSGEKSYVYMGLYCVQNKWDILNIWRTGIVSSFALKVTGVGLGFLLHFVSTRILGQQAYGEFAFNLSLAILLSVLARFSFDLSLVKIIVSYKERNEDRLIRGVIIWALIVTAVLCAGLFFIFSVIFAKYDISVSSYIFPLYSCIAFTMVAQGVLRAYGETVRAFSADMIGRPFIAILLMLLFYAMDISIDVEMALILLVLASIFMFLLSWFFVRLTCPVTVRVSKSLFELKKWCGVSIPIFFSNFVSVVEIQLVVIMAGIFLSSTETAMVSMCLRVAALATITSVAVNMYVAPKFAKYSSNGNEILLRSTIRTASKIMLLPVVPVLILSYYYGDKILSFIGPEYGAGWFVFNVFVIGRLAAALFGPVILVLQMTGSQKQSVYLTVFSTLAFAVTSMVYIPRYGVDALVLCFSCSVVFRQIIGLIYLKTKKNISCGIFSVFFPT